MWRGGTGGRRNGKGNMRVIEGAEGNFDPRVGFGMGRGWILGLE